MSVTKLRLTIAFTAISTVLGGNVFAETINAAGATFPAVIYQKWFQEYHKLHSDVQVNYQSIGSGAGIQQLTQGTVDFGASDMPMTTSLPHRHGWARSDL
jgi:phosphate transport system substrate-binding protein